MKRINHKTKYVNRRNKKGYTLVELAVGMAASLIVLLAAGTMASAGQRLWNQAWQKTELQRTASVVVARISSSVMNGEKVFVNEQGTVLTVRDTQNRDQVFTWDQETGDLYYEFDNNLPTEMVDAKITSMDFTVGAGKVDIDMTLNDGVFSTVISTSVAMRNDNL